MNKWLIALSAALVLLLLFGLVFYQLNVSSVLQQHYSPLPSNLYGLPLQVSSNNYKDGNGLSAAEKMDAITMALSNPTILGEIQHINDSSNFGLPDSINITISNATSDSTVESAGVDSGFLNLSSKIAYLYVSFNSRLADNYAVYEDLSNNRTLGLVKFEELVSPIATVTVPPGAIWYTQVSGEPRKGPEGQPVIQPYFSVNEQDVNTTTMMILSNDNFNKFKEGSPYTAIKYVDYMTNTTMTADGSQFLHIQSYNGIDTCRAFVSINNTTTSNAIDSFTNQNYYVLLENKNPEKEINITYSN